MAVKKLLNFHEKATSLRLDPACSEFGASVWGKVRVADVLPIERSGLPDEDYSYALQAHFDFLALDSDYMPLFAVEFDGPLHTTEPQSERDCRKNDLCKRFDFPLLRINMRYLQQSYRGDMDLLSWLVARWFLDKEYDRLQQSGALPPDEPFDVLSIVYDPSKPDERFPYWLSLDAKLGFRALWREGRVAQPVPSIFIGVDKRDRYRAIAWIQVNATHGVKVETGVQAQLFPSADSDFVGEIVTTELYRVLRLALAGEVELCPLDKISNRLETFTSGCQMTTFLQANEPGRPR